MKVLKGQKLYESDYADVQKQLVDIFYKIIFKPIVDLLAPRSAQVKAAAKSLKNAKEMRNAAFDPLVAGIRSGKIQYVDSVFSGNFNATISRALRTYGAKFNKRTGTFSVPPEALPVEVLSAAAERADADKKLHEAVDKTLEGIQQDLEKMIMANPVNGKKTILKMDTGFVETYGDALGTEGLSDAAHARLASSYEDSLKPPVKNFTDEMISDLRAIVKENAETGYRFDQLVTKIEERYSVTTSRAELIAQTETGIFTSKVRQQRFADVGINRYVWDTAGDSRVREDHKKLDGQIFDYAHPPIIDSRTGIRGNPGEIWRCRCLANPIIPGVLASA